MSHYALCALCEGHGCKWCKDSGIRLVSTSLYEKHLLREFVLDMWVMRPSSGILVNVVS